MNVKCSFPVVLLYGDALCAFQEEVNGNFYQQVPD